MERGTEIHARFSFLGSSTPQAAASASGKHQNGVLPGELDYRRRLFTAVNMGHVSGTCHRGHSGLKRKHIAFLGPSKFGAREKTFTFFSPTSLHIIPHFYEKKCCCPSGMPGVDSDFLRPTIPRFLYCGLHTLSRCCAPPYS